MPRRDHTFALAFTLALLIHAGLWQGLHYAADAGWAAPRWHLRLPTPHSTSNLFFHRDPDPLRPDLMGDRNGAGSAINSAPGDLPQLAPKANQDQAALSRDAEGLGSTMNLPTQWTGPQGNHGAGGNGLPRTANASSDDDRFGLPQPDVFLPPLRSPQRTANVIGLAPPETIPATVPANLAAASPNTSHSPSPPPTDAPAGTGPGGAPGAKQSADPFVQSDSESDPFSKNGAASLRRGKIDVRFGRKVKTIRPRLDIGGILDVPTLRFPSVQLRVKTDQTGKVTSVEILQSSGSPAIDEPTRLAVYDWQFEPLLDKDGNPQPDVMVWTLTFR